MSNRRQTTNQVAAAALGTAVAVVLYRCNFPPILRRARIAAIELFGETFCGSPSIVVTCEGPSASNSLFDNTVLIFSYWCFVSSQNHLHNCSKLIDQTVLIIYSVILLCKCLDWFQSSFLFRNLILSPHSLIHLGYRFALNTSKHPFRTVRQKISWILRKTSSTKLDEIKLFFVGSNHGGSQNPYRFCTSHDVKHMSTLHELLNYNFREPFLLI